MQGAVKEAEHTGSKLSALRFYFSFTASLLPQEFRLRKDSYLRKTCGRTSLGVTGSERHPAERGEKEVRPAWREETSVSPARSGGGSETLTAQHPQAPGAALSLLGSLRHPPAPRPLLQPVTLLCREAEGPCLTCLVESRTISRRPSTARPRLR